jgi:hypothetical protein
MAKHRLQHRPRSSWLPYRRLGNSLGVPLINQLATGLVLQYARDENVRNYKFRTSYVCQVLPPSGEQRSHLA